jgi:hypothetical protein
MSFFQVIDLYEELLWMIDLKRFPDDYEPPSIYFMLVSNLNRNTIGYYQQ